LSIPWRGSNPEEGVELEVVLDEVGCVKGDGEVLTWVKSGLWSTDATDEGISRDYECGE